MRDQKSRDNKLPFNNFSVRVFNDSGFKGRARARRRFEKRIHVVCELKENGRHGLLHEPDDERSIQEDGNEGARN